MNKMPLIYSIMEQIFSLQVVQFSIHLTQKQLFIICFNSSQVKGSS